MKTKLIPLMFLMPLVCAFSQIASATVIVNDAAIRPSPFGSGHLWLGLPLSQSDANGGVFLIDIETVTSSQYLFSYGGILERYELFLVASGTRFDPAFVLQNSPIVSNDNNPGSNTQIFALNQSKYFAYWDDRLNGGTPDSNDNYGWVLLTRTASGLAASSSATAIGGGIIAGTTTQVPEPASTMLMAFGSLLIFSRRVFRNDGNA